MQKASQQLLLHEFHAHWHRQRQDGGKRETPQALSWRNGAPARGRLQLQVWTTRQRTQVQSLRRESPALGLLRLQVGGTQQPDRGLFGRRGLLASHGLSVKQTRGQRHGASRLSVRS